MRAARWLEANGYFDASQAIARAARGELPPFWTKTRLHAFTTVLLHDNAPDWTSIEPIGTGAVLTNAATFLRAAGLMLLLRPERDISPASAAKIRRAIAFLAVAVLDEVKPGWRKTHEDP